MENARNHVNFRINKFNKAMDKGDRVLTLPYPNATYTYTPSIPKLHLYIPNNCDK